MASSKDHHAKLYIGTHDGVCFATTSDGGDSWETGPQHGLSHAAARLAPCAKQSRRVYLACYESGLLRSDDGGVSWKTLESYPSDYAHSVAVHPDNPDIVYAGSEPAALFRSADGGESWEECAAFRAAPESKDWFFHGNRLPHVRDLRLAPGKPERIYAGIEVGGMVRSWDAGDSWKQLHGMDADVHLIHVSQSEPDVVYAATAEGPYRSKDAGDSWQTLAGGLERRYSVAVVSAPDDPSRVLAAVANNAGRKGAQAYASTNSGDAWERIALGADDDMVVAFVWDPLDLERVYAGTDGGKLYVSENRGETWRRGQISIPSIAVGAMAAAPAG